MSNVVQHICQDVSLSMGRPCMLLHNLFQSFFMQGGLVDCSPSVIIYNVEARCGAEPLFAEAGIGELYCNILRGLCCVVQQGICAVVEHVVMHNHCVPA